jgi:hypothetical protein
MESKSISDNVADLKLPESAPAESISDIVESTPENQSVITESSEDTLEPATDTIESTPDPVEPTPAPVTPDPGSAELISESQNAVIESSEEPAQAAEPETTEPGSEAQGAVVESETLTDEVVEAEANPEVQANPDAEPIPETQTPAEPEPAPKEPESDSPPPAVEEVSPLAAEKTPAPAAEETPAPAAEETPAPATEGPPPLPPAESFETVVTEDASQSTPPALTESESATSAEPETSAPAEPSIESSTAPAENAAPAEASTSIAEDPAPVEENSVPGADEPTSTAPEAQHESEATEAKLQPDLELQTEAQPESDPPAVSDAQAEQFNPGEEKELDEQDKHAESSTVSEEFDVVNTDGPDDKPSDNVDTLVQDAPEPNPVKDSSPVENCASCDDVPTSSEPTNISSDADVKTEAVDQAPNDEEAEPRILGDGAHIGDGGAHDSIPVSETSNQDQTAPTEVAVVEAKPTTEDVATKPDEGARENSPELSLEASRAEDTAETASDALQEPLPQENTPDSTKEEESATLTPSGKCETLSN